MKKYLKELTEDELKQVFKTNKKLQDEIYKDLKENDNLFLTEQYNMFLENARSRYKYYDNYNSFYLRLNDLEGYYFLSDLNFNDLKDYSIVDDKTLKECTTYMKLYEQYDYSIDDKMQPISIEDLQDKLDELATKVLKGIEDYLHEIEFADYNYDDLLEEFLNTYDYYDKLYIEADANDFKAYKDFTTCYC